MSFSMTFRERYIGDRELYGRFMRLSIPMIVQNLITTFVSMIDNVMIGQIGTTPMSGVSICNEFIFIFNLTIFGAVSGAGIFGTQFFGKGDAEGQKYTVRFRLILVTVMSLIFVAVLLLFGTELIGLFLSSDSDPVQAAETLKYGREYLSLICIGMLPYGIGQAYASAIKECGETKIPMLASFSAIGINVILNYGLIFGKLGMPRLGVAGAAIATVIAKIAEALVMILWAHTHPARSPYITGLYRSFKIPLKLTRQIILKGCPLLFNEFFWAFGLSVAAQSYSLRGLDTVAARNIQYTLTDLFSVFYVQMGACIGIVLGNMLGAGRLEEAKETSRKLVFFAIAASLLLSVAMLPTAFYFPELYETTDAIRNLATYLILVQVVMLPFYSYTNAAYFVLRCGGKTGITVLFDFGFTWIVYIPTAFILAHFTNMGIRPLYTISLATELLKVIFGHYLIKSDIWVNSIVR